MFPFKRDGVQKKTKPNKSSTYASTQYGDSLKDNVYLLLSLLF